MSKLIIEINDSLLSKVLLKTQEQQVSLDTFINTALTTTLAEPTPPIRKNVCIETIVKNAVSHAESLEVGSQFLLTDICSSEDWEALSSGERKSLGKEFRKSVETTDPQIAKHIGRTSANKAIYERV